MLRIEELNEDLHQRTLHILQEVCGGRAILPDSHVIPCPLSLTAKPCVASKYAEVRKGRACFMEGGNDITDVCVKAIKMGKVHKVGKSSDPSLGQLAE